jgi:hypothetical protein
MPAWIATRRAWGGVEVGRCSLGLTLPFATRNPVRRAAGLAPITIGWKVARGVFATASILKALVWSGRQRRVCTERRKVSEEPIELSRDDRNASKSKWRAVPTFRCLAKRLHTARSAYPAYRPRIPVLALPRFVLFLLDFVSSVEHSDTLVRRQAMNREEMEPQRLLKTTRGY